MGATRTPEERRARTREAVITSLLLWPGVVRDALTRMPDDKRERILTDSGKPGPQEQRADSAENQRLARWQACRAARAAAIQGGGQSEAKGAGAAATAPGAAST